MSFGYESKISPNVSFKSELAMAKPLAKPIETVQKTIEGSVDTIVKTVDKDKDSHKARNAIAVASSVLVVSALVALLNPRISPKVVEKLKTISAKAEKRADKNKHDTLLKNFYQTCRNISEGTVKGIGFVNNFNTAKDAGFKYLCTEQKDFYGIRNKSSRRALKKIDSGARRVLSKPHKVITDFFDNIGKHTVLSKYAASSKKMDSLEQLILQHKDKLTDVQKKELETKLTEIRNAREYFSKAEITERFVVQEKAMTNLERDFWSKYRTYKGGFSNKWQDTSEHIGKNMSFWARDILYPEQIKLQQSGAEAVYKLMGDGKNQKGAYNEVIEIMAPHLSGTENFALEKSLHKASKSLKKANHSECVKYFDKKRDLVLGSAPTDIVTAMAGLGMSGVALTTADSKDERVSKLLTSVLPIVGGLGASMVFTARLISGPIGMISGAGVGVLLNMVGSFADKYILGNKKPEEVRND